MSDQKTNIINCFIESADKVETIVKKVSSSPMAISKLLDSIIIDDSKVVISKFRFIDEEILSDFLKSSKNIIHNPTDTQLASAKYGITDSFAGISETGSVCIMNDSSMAGSYSLFTEYHIVLLDSKTLLSRPRDIFLNEPYKSIALNENYIFVSGSSATADMGPLVRGVHGPAKLYVIILE